MFHPHIHHITNKVGPWKIERFLLQVADTGLDETSCFFVDEDREKIDHGYYFEELGYATITAQYSSRRYFEIQGIFDGGNFSYDLSRRKVRSIFANKSSDRPFTERDCFSCLLILQRRILYQSLRRVLSVLSRGSPPVVRLSNVHPSDDSVLQIRFSMSFVKSIFADHPVY